MVAVIGEGGVRIDGTRDDIVGTFRKQVTRAIVVVTGKTRVSRFKVAIHNNVETGRVTGILEGEGDRFIRFNYRVINYVHVDRGCVLTLEDDHATAKCRVVNPGGCRSANRVVHGQPLIGIAGC